MAYPKVAAMRLLVAGLALSTLTATAQGPPADVKNLVVPTMDGVPPIWVSALQIDRGSPYPDVVHLKGTVEIRQRVCVRTGPGNALPCDGYMVVRADEADVHEETGAVDARGNVRLTHEK
jgi:lipopolysaccharide assembly outer membrane protein LptD (OstA)